MPGNTLGAGIVYPGADQYAQALERRKAKMGVEASEPMANPSPDTKQYKAPPPNQYEQQKKRYYELEGKGSARTPDEEREMAALKNSF